MATKWKLLLQVQKISINYVFLSFMFHFFMSKECRRWNDSNVLLFNRHTNVTFHIYEMIIIIIINDICNAPTHRHVQEEIFFASSNSNASPSCIIIPLSLILEIVRWIVKRIYFYDDVKATYNILMHDYPCKHMWGVCVYGLNVSCKTQLLKIYWKWKRKGTEFEWLIVMFE